MAEDLREASDAMQADMAAHQRRFAGEVTASLNQALAADFFQRFENERADSKPAPAIEPPAQQPVEAKTERCEVDGKSYLVSTAPGDDIDTRPPTPAENWFMTHAMPRIELLLTKQETGPLGQASWATRTLAVLDLQSRANGLRAANKHAEADELSRRFMFEIVDLLEASTAPFGDWKKDPERKIYFHGT